MIRKDVLDRLIVRPGKKLRLKDHETSWAQNDEFRELGQEEIKDRARAILGQPRELG